MKRFAKKLALTAMALTLLLSLGSCGGKTGGLTKFDAKTYVDGLLRENYLGETTKEYMELVGINEEEVQETYEAGIASEVNFFLNMYNIEYPDDALYEELTELYKKIYSHAKFTVNDAAVMDDGSFVVTVEVEPIDIVQLVDTDWDKEMADFYEKYPMEVQNAMTEAEYQAMDKEYARLVLELYQEKLTVIGNMTSKTLAVEIKKDDEGYYGISDEYFASLDELIIDYTNNVGAEA